MNMLDNRKNFGVSQQVIRTKNDFKDFVWNIIKILFQIHYVQAKLFATYFLIYIKLWTNVQGLKNQ